MYIINNIKKIATSSTAFYVVLLVFFLVTIDACKEKETEVVGPAFEGFKIPTNFPQPTYTFQNNPITKEGFELGRELFYDPLLSKDNSISCGSCHRQFAAFSDYQHIVSHGINNQLTKRNSPGLFNIAWSNSFMWDGGINHIEVMPLAPITNPIEMGESLSNVLYKLNNHPTYPLKFKQAFGVDSITSKTVLLAFAQFMGMMVSADSKYDKYLRKEQNVLLSSDELEGLALFTEKCATCHNGVLQSDQSFRNNGLDTDHSIDPGRFEITGSDQDKGKFKVPSLRNIYITPPYMHDGRIKTLEDVVEHYRSKIKNSATLDPILSGGIEISDTEKTQLILFLKTLTDFDFTKNEKFKEPIR